MLDTLLLAQNAADGAAWGIGAFLIIEVGLREPAPVVPTPPTSFQPS